MRVALVNDLTLAIEVLRRVVRATPDAEVAWIAVNGQEAVDRCRADPPDLILMDLVMPVMNGVEATRAIMESKPCPILVTTATLTGNCELVYDALGVGAVDAVETPVLGADGELRGGKHLARKMRSVLSISRCPPSRTPPASAATVAPAVSHHIAHPALIVIGASTGGPLALRQLLSDLGRRDVSVVIVQHLEPVYMAGFAEWLTNDTGWAVSLIEAGARVTAGKAYLAHTTDHLILDDTGHFRHVTEPTESIHRPSIDVFFSSLAQVGASPGVAVLLTGMGRDGALGMKRLRAANWTTIAQDESSSVVWGMPAAAIRESAACHVLPLGQIGETIDQLVMTQGKHQT